MDISKIKFRASKFDTLCGTSTKANKILTDKAENYLNEIYEETIFGKKPEIYTPQIEKGKRCEKDAIALVRKKYQKFFAPVPDSNEGLIQNKYVTGHVDGLYTTPTGDLEVHEIKTPFLNETWFRYTEKENKKRGYITQVKIYLWILGAEKGYIHICGVNTPEDLILRDLQKNGSYNKETFLTSKEYQEWEEAMIRRHKFDVIPEKQRVKTYEVILTEEDKTFFESRAKIAIEYLQKLADAETLDLAIQKKDDVSYIATENGQNLSVEDKIVSKYREFGIELAFEETIESASVKQYRFKPLSAGVKIDKAKRYNADIQSLIQSDSVIIETPIKNTNLIGIQTPKKSRDILKFPKLKQNFQSLKIELGKTINNEKYTLDIAKAPHILIGGATGSGKSVLIKSIFKQLENNKIDFKILDPKFEFEDSIKEPIKIYKELKETKELIKERLKIQDKTKISPLVLILDEMETLLSENQKLDYEIDEKRYPKFLTVYNQTTKGITTKQVKNPEYLEQIKIQKSQPKIGEACKEIIEYITRIGRSEKVHLILATQNPTVKNVSSSIKANCPTRICLRVATQINSKVILDEEGGEKLLGNGDMLVRSPFSNDLTRIQSYFVN